jgi:putative endopeptidase
MAAPEGAFDRMIVRQPTFASGMGEALREVDLEDWQSWLVWHVITSMAPVLPESLVNEDFDFYGRTLSGQPEIKERWKRGVEVVESGLGEAVGELYAAKWFPPEAKERMQQLVANLVEAFRRSFRSLEWMSEQTRAEAVAKLDRFTPKIGYPDVWRDYSALEIDEDLVGNVTRAAAFEHDRNLAKIGRPIDRTEWFMLPQTVNAYYMPSMNEIVFPAAILQPPFFDIEADDAVNYGGIGAVIGHELGHGFDDQGSRYDGSGALRDWWTEEDRERFDALAARLIKQFDTYTPSGLDESHKVSGGLTVGENIGDLGGLQIGYAAYRIATEDGGMPEIDGFTGPQRFFVGWAQVWKGKARTEEAIRLLAIDPHSPQELRANAVRNVSEFHEAFGVKPGDALWLDEDERVRIF